ncbi:hypothetical protein TRP8649_00107 [Pelagimonas phthalicica]|uniref:Uncharacterized protein n=1 Tax=Pelagimonas phthalicica TaxID=1037362 RepID=A0A238J6N8_9RHOB|nr:hypothetical protein [Pelagimonas phthalicica]TDS95442.1 hypothetical protein CLV87_1966 [Pelagimonas phthalicica]SMX26035.1 hypothetical protein TRP8649_00107 [Pelagimonas phthalicica]
MMSRLLSLCGTCALASTAAGVAVWANGVVQSQPDLGPLSVETDVFPAAAQQTKPENRPQKSDVFYSAVTQRPIFAPTRRAVSLDTVKTAEPAPTSAPAPKPILATPPEVRLLGVMGTAQGNTALISHAGGNPIWVTQKETLGGWQISDIFADALELRLKTQTIRIEMYQ